MDKISRRSFVKRTGGVTLGSVLGLGILPSVTRKLHATDSSIFVPATLPGVKLSWGETEMRKTVAYFAGSLEIGIVMDADAPKSQCNLTGTMHAYRYGVYREVRNGSSYSGVAWDDGYYNWHCSNGAATLKSAYGTASGPMPIKNSAGASIGSIYLETSAASNPQLYASARVHQNGAFGATEQVGPLSYQPACCTIG